MSKVYYKPINTNTSTEEVQQITRELLEKLIKEENLQLEKNIPLKVHFGEVKNKTFIRSENYEGIISWLKERDIESSYIETNVLYGGKRFKKELHLKTAEEHGFTQLPVIIADGDYGDDFEEVKVGLKHYDTCKIGKEFLNYNQIIVLSHFKGHMLAGFGGALKQLAMGHASKGGKLAMHLGTKPRIKNKKCTQCELCKTRCNEDAITIGEKSFIDHEKCVGCGACVAICPEKAITIFSIKGIYNAVATQKRFREKIAEYAFAAQKDKRNIYINFGMNITKGCDCEPKKMKVIMDDFGIFISTDPVAIDKACWEMTKQNGKAFKGKAQLKYAEEIGLGSTEYQLVSI